MTASNREGSPTAVGSWNWIHWLGVLLSLAVGVVNLFIGVTESQLPFLVVGASFLLGVGLYASRFWRPVLYLLGILHVSALGVVWVLDGMQFFRLGVLSGVLGTGIAVVALYLFLEEGTALEPGR